MGTEVVIGDAVTPRTDLRELYASLKGFPKARSNIQTAIANFRRFTLRREQPPGPPLLRRVMEKVMARSVFLGRRRFRGVDPPGELSMKLGVGIYHLGPLQIVTSRLQVLEGGIEYFAAGARVDQPIPTTTTLEASIFGRRL